MKFPLLLPLLTLMTLLNTACQTASAERPSAPEPGDILFEDSMTGDWRDQWFLDGEKAILTQDENGLHFQADGEENMFERRRESPEMRELFDSYHAVLWTQQEFEGEIGLSFEMTRTSPGFTFLIYMLAQGVGWGPYAEDITEWNDLRTIPRMDLYHDGMNLTCVTFRWQIRLRRYPWVDEEGNRLNDNLIGEFITHPEYDYIPPENSYKVDIELRTETLRIRIEEIGNPDNVLDRTFNRVDDLDPRRPAPSTRGRIGIRHMINTGVRYRNVQVRQL
ncbi:MAG: hypothetical protein JJU05_04715 [Verrucomicrobia bacterium]|nr:hypothetical protein [Verrucomicrobiota bacterium]MCH8526851.1 hypothetical protein [Kiritimatiellia bacterium]